MFRISHRAMASKAPRGRGLARSPGREGPSREGPRTGPARPQGDGFPGDAGLPGPPGFPGPPGAPRAQDRPVGAQARLFHSRETLLCTSALLPACVKGERGRHTRAVLLPQVLAPPPPPRGLQTQRGALTRAGRTRLSTKFRNGPPVPRPPQPPHHRHACTHRQARHSPLLHSRLTLSLHLSPRL